MPHFFLKSVYIDIMPTAEHYTMDVEDFAELYKKSFSPPNTTFNAFKCALRRIETAYGVDLPSLKLEFLTDHKDLLEKLDNLGYSDATKYGTMGAVAKLIRMVDMPLKQQSEIRALLKTMREERDKKQKQQLKTTKEDENWVEYPQLLEKLDEQHENYINTDEDFMKYLLLNFFVRMTPVRLGNYRNMEIKTLKDEYTLSADLKGTTKNYLYRLEDGNYYFLFGQYKTAKFYGMRLVKIDDEKLQELLDVYFVKHPNHKFFLGKPTNVDMTRMLQKITRKLFSKNISCNLLRHIYITHFLNKNPTLLEKIELANECGHSLMTQELYKKQ